MGTTKFLADNKIDREVAVHSREVSGWALMVNVTQPSGTWEEGTSVEKLRSSDWSVCAAVSWLLTDVGRPSSLWVVPFPTQAASRWAWANKQLSTVVSASVSSWVPALTSLEDGCDMNWQAKQTLSSPSRECLKWNQNGGMKGNYKAKDTCRACHPPTSQGLIWPCW